LLTKARHFISGLPRSGSTLLSAILNQNPDFHAGPSSMVCPLFNQLLFAMQSGTELAIEMDEELRSNVFRGVLEGYYAGIDKTIFDTNRFWCHRLPLLKKLYPDANVIVCVRDPVWILDSFERLISKQVLGVSRLMPPAAHATVFTRTEYLASDKGLLGMAMRALREAVGVHEIEYETLARNPGDTMLKLYNALGLPAFKHDFENVVLHGSGELDHWLGVPGLHSVRPKVEYIERETILPPEIVERYRVWQ
jgi:sulfotransferase